MKKPLLAKKLDVKLQAEKTTITSHARNLQRRPPGDHRSSTTSMDTISIFEEVKNLDLEKTYTKGEYSFEFTIPDKDFIKQDFLGARETQKKFIRVISPDSTEEEVDWYIYVDLAVPKSVDLENYVKIEVFRR